MVKNIFFQFPQNDSRRPLDWCGDKVTWEGAEQGCQKLSDYDKQLSRIHKLMTNWYSLASSEPRLAARVFSSH